MKISVIGGGNMGGAIAIGAIRQKIVVAQDVTISHLSQKMRPLFGQELETITLNDQNNLAITGADYIILAVKPWMVEEVLAEISERIDRTTQSIISVVAGVSFEKLEEILNFQELGAMPLFRVIPNTAISIGKGVSIIASHRSDTLNDQTVEKLFGALGATFMVSEEMMTPLTSLSSCGIAFALRFLDAASKGGSKVGIDPDMSLEVTLKTMEGAIALLRHNNSQPQAEIDKVTTKGGITLKGLEAMEREGFSTAVVSAIEESR